MIKFRKLKNLKIEEVEEDEDVYDENSNSDLAKAYHDLDKLLPELFPNDKAIKEIIKKHKNKKGVYHKDEYILECLPFNLRNKKWLYKYVLNFVKDKGLFFQFDLESLESYVYSSPKFENASKEFGEKFMRLKLENMMKTTRAEHETIVDAGFPDISHRIDCDEFFRQHALSYFILKGFDSHSVELALERNADVWRRKSMLQAFENTCNLEIVVHDYPKSPISKVQYLRCKHDYRKLWIKYREYEYYQKHKKVINELNQNEVVHLDDVMKMSAKEASQLLYNVHESGSKMTQALNKGLFEEESKISNDKITQ